MRRRRATRAAVLVGLLVSVSTLLRFWGGSNVPIPWINPDEIIYGELGRSLYANGTLRILGRPTEFISLVYPALAGLPLSLGNLERGYHLLKLVQALAMSLTAIPVYLWARSLGARYNARLRAYLATALALCLWFPLEVGIFASQHVGYLAERNMLPLAPVLFVGFAVWLARGAPRPRVASCRCCRSRSSPSSARSRCRRRTASRSRPTSSRPSRRAPSTAGSTSAPTGRSPSSTSASRTGPMPGRTSSGTAASSTSTTC